MSASLSLVVPSGHLTLGDLLGAVLGWTTDQRQVGGLYGVADLHALTLEHDPAQVRALTLEQVGVLLAAGLDPQRCTIFVQSQVPAHTELLWLLESTVHVGELQRMVQFKQKAAGRGAVRASLLTYPALMAADILLYGAEEVPVGDDQRQHLELARAIAQRFNASYGETFVVPRAATPAVAARVMDLQRPREKMSKSAREDRGVIRVLDPPEVVRRKIARAVTDADALVRHDPERKPGVSNLLEILAALSGTDVPVLVERFAGAGYGDLKKEVEAAYLGFVEPFRERVQGWLADGSTLDDVLADGARRAREQASVRLADVYEKVGFLHAGAGSTP